MPKPSVTLIRKVLYKEKNPKSRVTPKISIPRWWVGDTDKVKLIIYTDKIVIKRIEG